MRRILLGILCVVSVVICSTHPARANDTGRPTMTAAQEQEADTIIEQTMSPYCAARMLNDCPSSQAVELRNVIRSKVIAGESPDQILQYLYKRYGEAVVRALPDRTGKGFIAWAAPWLFALAGLVGAITWLSIRARSTTPTAPSGTGKDAQPVSLEMKNRIDKMVQE